jgi:hypothetical protein
MDSEAQAKAVPHGARHSCRFNAEHGSVFDDFWWCPVEAV